MYIRIAWRNIWRNTKRTLILLLTIIIGIWSMIFLGGLMRGMTVSMIHNGIATLTGDIQIHAAGYRDDPSVDHSMYDLKKLKYIMDMALPKGSRYAFRVRVNAIIANARHSSGVTMVGINPEKEPEVSFIGPGALLKGKYFVPGNNNGILIGRALAEKFETRIGHKLIIMSEDSHHEIASKALKIIGIFHADMQSTEKRFVFVTYSFARHMLRLGKAASEVAIVLPDDAKDEKAATDLKHMLSSSFVNLLDSDMSSHSCVPGFAASGSAVAAGISEHYEIYTWQELLPILTSYLKMFDGFMYIWFVVVFIAMGFGIVNTTLMAVYERIREFGLLKALGMKPWFIIRLVLTESFMLLGIGGVIGNVIGLMSIRILTVIGINLSALASGAEFAGLTRIIYPVIYLPDIVMANTVVIILGLTVSVYPAVKAAKFMPVEALAHI